MECTPAFRLGPAWCALFPRQLRMNCDRGAGKAAVFT